MKNIFTQVENTRPETNTFDISHDRKMSMKFGQITPVLNMEILPGDKINITTHQLLRMAPMIAPVMHEVNVYMHAFFVPNRLLWANWEEFITGGFDGSSEPAHPFISFSGTVGIGGLPDYLGVPQELGATPKEVNALPFCAYNKIYNEYYRDQNLVNPIIDFLNDGSNSATFFDVLKTRAWQHDYFTSALPWTQKGAEVTIPLGTEAPLRYKDGVPLWRYSDDDQPISNGSQLQSGPLNGLMRDFIKLNTPIYFDPSQGGPANESAYYADLSEATASTIIDLRNAFSLQEFLEKNARGGSRLIELIETHFGVKSSDARLQRPEFLGGGRANVTISEVLQTSSTTTEPTPQGNMAGHGISVGSASPIKYYSEEHGWLLILCTVMPRSSYQQGIHKSLLKRDKFSYYWPSFAHIGEQPIEQQEIYAETTTPTAVFGYTPRYAEYKYLPSTVHGHFKTTLDFWHMGRIFANNPVLNANFIEMKSEEVTRIFAVTEAEQLYTQIYFDLKATRKMPYFGNPSII